jgi:hypothetical protein
MNLSIRIKVILLTLLTCFLMIFSSSMLSFSQSAAFADNEDRTIAQNIPPSTHSVSFGDGGNPKRFPLIKDILTYHGFSYKAVYDIKANEVTRFLVSENLSSPAIEYIRIDPTKYRLRIYGVNKNFPLIFSETYHRGWSAYLTVWREDPAHQSSTTLILPINPSQNPSPSLSSSPEDHGGQVGLASFRSSNIVKINNNLSEGKFWETWFPSSLRLKCDDPSKKNEDCKTPNPELLSVEHSQNSKVIFWPESLHWKANGFANSWWFDLDILKKLPKTDSQSIGYYHLRPDGRVDMEVIIEFWPQRLFYVGLFIAGLIIFVCLCIFLWSNLAFLKRSQRTV